MNTEKAKMKWSDFTGAFVLAAISFGLAAVFIYMAYVGLASGTAFKTKSYPFWVPHLSGQLFYNGVFTRDENPGRFWFVEIIYVLSAVIFAIAGVQPLWETYKEHRQQKLSALHHANHLVHRK